MIELQPTEIINAGVREFIAAVKKSSGGKAWSNEEIGLAIRIAGMHRCSTRS
jgi:hypothetical protein